MRLGVLFSGGKDSCAALATAQAYGHEIACLLTLESRNPASYMFHTPNISLTGLQASAIGLPIMVRKTAGEKEGELADLKALLEEAKREHRIEGVVTGAIGSVYQATRVQDVCARLGLWVFNPLWQRDEHEHMTHLIEEGFEIAVSGIAAYPLTAAWLGRRIDASALVELEALKETYGLSPAGEGGEIETLVLWAPGWNKRLCVTDAFKEYENHAGTWHVKEAVLEAVTHEKKGEKKGKKPGSPGAKQGSILVVSLCEERLSEDEFVRPIIHAIAKPCRVIHHREMSPEKMKGTNAILLSGTPLQDDAFLEGDFAWLEDAARAQIPVVGICAGMQAIAKAFGAFVERKEEIGMIRVRGEAVPFPASFEAYALHRNAVSLPEGFTACARSNTCLEAFKKGRIIGILFHPEARNKELIGKLLS